MKAFIFLDEEYHQLNSLGLAFAQHFKDALTAIQDKNFLKFIRKFKEKREVCIQALYHSKYLQSALSILIYHMTDDQLLILGGKRYERIEDVIEALGNDYYLQLFLADKGLRSTLLLPPFEDEKLKLNLLALEEHYNDEFAITFMKNYYKYDSIETLDTVLNDLFISSEERFGRAVRLFGEEKVQIHLGHRYSLAYIMQLRNQACPIFSALQLLQADYKPEELEPLLEDTFYWFTFENIKKYKGKKQGKDLLNKISQEKKNYAKHAKKMNFSQKVSFQEKLYELYLSLVEAYKKGQIVVKKDCEQFAFDTPYIGTYISLAYMEGRILCLDEQVEEFTPSERLDYDLKVFNKAILNHKHFGIWMIVFTIIAILYFAAACILSYAVQSVEIPAFNAFVDLKGGLIPFIISSVLLLFASIFILVKNALARKKYFRLCKLVYYQNNETILTIKERKDFEKIKSKEAKDVKTIDRFYRFYGAFAMGILSILMSLIGLDVMLIVYSDVEEMTSLFSNYLLYIPSLIPFLIGCLRHKKTAWSALFAFVLGLGIGVLILLLKMKM